MMKKTSDVPKIIDYDYCGDKVVNDLVYRHIERAIESNKKYKDGGIHNRHESLEQWVQEALEEAMDMSVYLCRLLDVLKTIKAKE